MIHATKKETSRKMSDTEKQLNDYKERCTYIYIIFHIAENGQRFGMYISRKGGRNINSLYILILAYKMVYTVSD